MNPTKNPGPASLKLESMQIKLLGISSLVINPL
jgi:hypothetical protein